TAAALLLDANASLRFVPAPNFNGAVPTLTAHLVDNSAGAITTGNTANLGTTGGATPYSSGTLALGETGTAANDAPAGADKTSAILEDQSHTFVAADFGFSDPIDAASSSGANIFAAVKIDTVAGGGALTDNGVVVSAGQVVSIADINAGKL